MKNRKKILERCKNKLVTIKFLDGESYTGTLLPKQDEKYAYFILYEEDGYERSKYFQWQTVAEIWIYYEHHYKIMYKRTFKL